MKKICECCGKIFEAKNNNFKYCDNCRFPKIKCAVCGKTAILKGRQLRRFLTSKGTGDYYCSAQCAKGGYKYCKVCKEKTYHSNWKQCMKHDNPFSKEEIKEKIRQTNRKNLGVDYPGQSEKVKKKIKASIDSRTKEDKLRTYKKLKKTLDNRSEKEKRDIQEKIIATNMRKRKVKYPTQSEQVKRKVIKTIEEKYNVKNVSQIDWVKDKKRDTFIQHYGAINFSASDEGRRRLSLAWKNMDIEKKKRISRKRTTTRVQNNNIPKSELLFIRLLEEYGLKETKDYIIGYCSEKYPFSCDFYIIKYDLYVEINCHWTHGKYWFTRNKNNLAILHKWEKKAKDSKFYENAVNTWTKRDVRKRKVARKHKLNYVVLWTMKDIENWFTDGMPVRQDWK